MAGAQSQMMLKEASVRVRFVFEPRTDDNVTPTDVALTLLELQRLWIFLAYLGDETDPAGGGTRQDWDAFLADPPNWSLAIEKIRFGSPLEIQSAPSGGQLRASTSRFRSIFQVIVQILTVDLIREKAKWDTELAKQRAIEAALKNHERALELSKKTKDPAMRKEFSRNVAHSIGFLSGPERCS